MIYYCTNCWSEIDKSVLICPFCNANQNESGNENYITKLIRALDHPEPSTPIRVAGILAQLKEKKAIPYLVKRLKIEKDPYIIEAFVNALVKIDLDKAKLVINKILSDSPVVTIAKLLES
jgi:HEAT repeat protein